MKLFTIVVAVGIVSLSDALECGLSSSQNQDLKRYTDICMMKATRNDQSVENSSVNQSYEASYEDGSDSTLEEAVDNKKSLNNMHADMMTKETMMDGVKDESMLNNNSMRNGDDLNNTEITNNCVVQCVFKQLGMIDSSGYPDHGKISESLVRGAENRELKDFLQDSTNECFQMMEQEEHVDSCYFSTQLVKCLAERGRSNCSDWPMSDFPLGPIF
uniref:OBP19 n=1 Tax=Holotrichia parallela TaxID=93412 RepID=A0A0G2YD91_HOLPA|nr:OBP19 [Holotrichia parallela]